MTEPCTPLTNKIQELNPVTRQPAGQEAGEKTRGRYREHRRLQRGPRHQVSRARRAHQGHRRHHCHQQDQGSQKHRWRPKHLLCPPAQGRQPSLPRPGSPAGPARPRGRGDQRDRSGRSCRWHPPGRWGPGDPRDPFLRAYPQVPALPGDPEDRWGPWVLTHELKSQSIIIFPYVKITMYTDDRGLLSYNIC